jgi:hypothetical protein
VVNGPALFPIEGQDLLRARQRPRKVAELIGEIGESVQRTDNAAPLADALEQVQRLLGEQALCSRASSPVTQSGSKRTLARRSAVSVSPCSVAQARAARRLP